MSKDARGRPRKKTNNSRPRRPRITTKEELEQYLSAHPESEYPLVEEVWEKAIQTSKDNEQKIIEAESNGEEPNKRVAIKLIIGHIIHTIIEEIASVIKIGLSCGVTILNASFVADFSTIKNSRTNATGSIITIS